MNAQALGTDGPWAGRVLAINVGSSSLKAALVAFPGGEEQWSTALPVTPAGIDDAMAELTTALAGAARGPVDAAGHRVVHGGEKYSGPALVDAATLHELESLSPLAPLHNPPAMKAIRAALQSWPRIPHVAIFDTAFHRTMPAVAADYAVPESWRGAGVRRYGFHGMSHGFVRDAVSRSLGADARDLCIVSCHLGNGASACAIGRGISVDTSMGMTPLEGLIMATRPGDLDPGAGAHLHRTLGLGPEAFESALNSDCGLSALSGMGGDMRVLEAAAAAGDQRARDAIDAFAYRITKYIGAYAAAMGRLDVIAFTAGIGERSPGVRSRACGPLRFLGVEIDEARNRDVRFEAGDVVPVHGDGSRVKVLVVKAREERTIAFEVSRFLAGGGK